jgi:hypothetical protein
VGLILDLAVAALALAVVGSLWLLAWTLGVSSVRAMRLSQERVAASRRTIADAEARLRSSAARATATLSELAARSRAPIAGERPDA